MTQTHGTAPFRAPNQAAPLIAGGLLQIRAVELRPSEPFTWSSGWKSPIYCDNRLILSNPILRDMVINAFVELLQTHYPGVDVIAGTSTAGIPHAAMIADRLGLPMVYVRSSAKEHGQRRQVEGRVFAGQRAVVIEDTLSTGKSAYEAVSALRGLDVEVVSVFSIFSYDFPAVIARVQETGVPAERIVDFQTLIEVAESHGHISESDRELISQWRVAPEQYGR